MIDLQPKQLSNKAQIVEKKIKRFLESMGKKATRRNMQVTINFLCEIEVLNRSLADELDPHKIILSE